METMCRLELLQLPLGYLLHSFSQLVDFGSLLVIEFAVIPNQLEVSEEFLISAELGIEHVLLESVEVHWASHDGGVVQESELCRHKGSAMPQNKSNLPSHGTGIKNGSHIGSASMLSSSFWHFGKSSFCKG